MTGLERGTGNAALENAISKAGRDRVFAVVRAAGWTPRDSIPEFVWWEAVRMVRAAREPGAGREGE